MALSATKATRGRKLTQSGEARRVLLIAVTVIVLSALGFLLVAAAARTAMRRLGLEFWSVADWFGLVDMPADELAARRGVSGRRGPAPRRSAARSAP
jgi:hypothetical protein